ncbi:MAG: S-adenosylmethionine decarboxylase [Selenomonadaceae bacterium]|nr:S-adenosylmethionine decarboxylase [Selenomonadaceae bacterium]
MKILSRQLTLDLYNCSAKKLSDIEEVKKILQEAIGEEPKLTSAKIDGERLAIIGAFMEGHIALHVYGDLRYVAADIFTCAENIEPEEIASVLRKYFKPDKVKSTFLNRGDLNQKDMKPKITTRVAPLRRVRNAGEKVVRTLVRRSKD